MKPPIQRLESFVVDLRRSAEAISAFARNWKEAVPEDSTETLTDAFSAISDIADDLDEWAEGGEED